VEDSVKPDASDDDVAGEVDVADLICDFEDSFTSSQRERELSERDRDYYDGDQLSGEELEALRKRKQPPVISNRIGPKIDTLLGHELKMRTEPKAYPRTPQHEDDANSVTDSISYVCEANKFDTIRSAAAENLFIEGIGAGTVTAKMVNGRMEVKQAHVPWDRFYRDPHSSKPDFSDASYLGEVLWMDEGDALRDFPGKEDVIESCYAEGNMAGDTYDDRPRLDWSDKKRHRVRVLHHRFRHNGEWWAAIFCRGGFLWGPVVSPYLDEHDEPTCDLIACSAYVTRENERYGVVRRHISPQDEINKRRSKALHLLNSKKIIAEKGAVENVEQARREAARPDGFLQINPNMRFEFVEEQTLVAGQFQLLQESKAEIDISGVNPALAGDQAAPSGRAQEVQISAGLAEQGKVFESLRQWSWEMYRQTWYRIRQYWNDERWIRVTDDEKNLRWVPVNKPVTLRDQIIEKARAAQEAGQPFDPGIAPDDPRLDQVVATKNPLGELDVDVILEDAPEAVNLQSEQFQALVELKKADPSAIPTKAIIQASTLRNKDEILDYLDKGGIPPQVQKQMQDMQQQLQEAQQELQKTQLELQQAKGSNVSDIADKQLQAAELEIKRYEAETARIVALRPQPLEAVPTGWPVDGQVPGPDAFATAAEQPRQPA
jgi:hypothetical protein